MMGQAEGPSSASRGGKKNIKQRMKKKGEGRTRDLETTRQSILDAAAREFSAHGFSGARVDRISRAAGVNKAMIYYIFNNKDELHLAVLEDLFEAKIRQVEEHLEGPPRSLENLFPVLQVYFRALLDKRDYATIILHDLAAGGLALRALKEKRPDLFAEFDTVATLLRTMQQAGTIRDLDPDKGVILIIVLMVGLAGLLPHMDLAAEPGTPDFQSLSDRDEWLIFMADMLFRVLNPDR